MGPFAPRPPGDPPDDVPPDPPTPKARVYVIPIPGLLMLKSQYDPAPPPPPAL